MSKYGPWIAHNGDECPVDGDKCVMTCLEGSGVFPLSKSADQWNWDSKINEIIAYRVLKEPVVNVWISKRKLEKRRPQFQNSFVFNDFCPANGGYPVEIKMVETDGDREWFIEEIA